MEAEQTNGHVTGGSAGEISPVYAVAWEVFGGSSFSQL